ncbi:uncharacterized protein EV154DRAFT_572932 [Mucor mucedo]|uniref:uncharacterized protein n=1 Tax=Mucor mucedo TaxID=29922 RepID=UPI00222051DB|nr:uncharacterized protein EV154DRAFT_572932 [Mucor mucedo]KAI7862585.1 hypothetical protein EV154DRAFT_572932 [Mucor mucedo]
MKKRNPVIEALFTKLSQSNNVGSLTEVHVEDIDTIVTDTLTCLKCHVNYNSKGALTKHLKAKHQIVIIGAKRGRPNIEKKLMKQIRKKISYEAVKYEKNVGWIASERETLLEDLRVLWEMSGTVWTADCAYVEYLSEITPMYQFLITKLLLDDSYELRVEISLSILEMMFERFPGMFKKDFNQEVVLEALTPLKFNKGNDREQENVRTDFDFDEVDHTEMKKLLESHRNCKDINRARLDIMRKLCFLIQIHFGVHNFEF